MTLAEVVHRRRDEIRRVAAKHGVHTVRVFGSAVRGDARPDSDVDLLVEVGPQPSSWFPAGLILELQELLGRKVDVVTPRGLSPHIREQVLSEAEPL